LLVFTLGPEKSRPFINALHFFISIGYLIGTFLVQPFLPSGNDKVCTSQIQNYNDENEINNTGKDEVQATNKEESIIPISYGVHSIAWPFIISGGIISRKCFLLHS